MQRTKETLKFLSLDRAISLFKPFKFKQFSKIRLYFLLHFNSIWIIIGLFLEILVIFTLFSYRIMSSSVNSGVDPKADRIVQYIILRRDLLEPPLSWTLGALIAQGCHASIAALV